MENHTLTPENQQYRGSFQELADARRVLKMMNGLAAVPGMAADDRQEVQRVRAHAIRCIEAATAELIETLDVALGDPDLEPNGDELDGFRGEDDFCDHPTFNAGSGCPVSDPGGCEHDGRELEHQTWPHWMDHPAELHVGSRPGHTDDQAVRK